MDNFYSTCNDLFDSNYTPNKWLYGAIEYVTSTGWIIEFDVKDLAEYLNEMVDDFYKHYQDINQLIEDILRYYHQRNHRYYLEMLQKIDGSVKDKIVFCFLRYIERNDLKFEIAIRNFSRKNEFVYRFLKRLDKQKVNSLTNIFVADGFTEEEAESRANLIFYNFLGKLNYLSPDRTNEKKIEDFMRVINIIVKKFDN